MSGAAVIVLAAGKSTRMKSRVPKVLHCVCGLPVLDYVLHACSEAEVERQVVVVGHEKERIVEHYHGRDEIDWVEQQEQKGTGHAVLCCREVLAGFSGSVLVIAGDMPLIRGETLVELTEAREQKGDALTLATALLDNPAGYGRIIRSPVGEIEAIVEQKDCTERQRTICEVNPSYYCFDCQSLFEALDAVQPNPQSGEVYLTETVRVLRSSGAGVSAVVRVEPEEGMGINSRLDLAAVGRIMQDRIQLSLMNEGVTIVDPDNTWVEAGATVGPDSIIHPFSFIGTGAMIGAECEIGPGATVPAGASISAQEVVRSSQVSKAGSR